MIKKKKELITDMRSRDNPSVVVNLGQGEAYNFHWGRFINGYRNATKRLIESALSAGWAKSEVEDLAMPILFLCRFRLEISLKKYISDLNFILKRNEKFTATHNLIPLWEKLNLLTKDLGFSKDRRLPRVDKLIRTLNTLDQTSERFRYPVNKSGKLFSGGLQLLNLRVLLGEMTAVDKTFEKIEIFINKHPDRRMTEGERISIRIKESLFGRKM
jgi:hypothetical protein